MDRETSEKISEVQKSRQHLASRQRLRKLLSAEPPTAPMNIVDRLAGSPYAKPVIQVEGVDRSARKILDFALNLAETMFRFGAGALEVETAIIAVTAAFGLRNVEVDITNQSVIINYAPKDANPTTVMRVVRSWTDNFAGLSMAHQLVTEITDGKIGLALASQQLKEIRTTPKPYPRWLSVAAAGFFAGCVVAIIGGGPVGAAITAIVTVLVQSLARVLARWRVPAFFTVALSASVITLIALILVLTSLPIEPGTIVTGGILLMIPSGALVSAVQDSLNGFPVTAAGRFMGAFLMIGAIIAGIAVASVVGSFLGVSAAELADIDAPYVPPLPMKLGLVAAALLVIGIVFQTRPQLLLPTAAIGFIGYLAFLGFLQIGVGERLSPALAAIVVGFGSRFVALRMGSPRLVIAIPAVLLLLSGLRIFRAMFELAISSGSLSGVVGLFNAMVVILGVAAGVVLGDSLARPFDRTRSGRSITSREE